MKQIKVIKKHDGHKPGKVLTVTDMTAKKRIDDELAEYVNKEDKEIVETKEDKEVIETKEVVKAPKTESKEAPKKKK